MNKGFGNDDARLARYVSETYRPEDDALRDVRERSDAAGLPDIQVAALDSRHLEVLVRMTGARRALEIGTLGGYSGLAIFRGMQPGGTLTTLELEAAHAAVAAETFRRAGVAERARILQGRALDLLPTLVSEPPFDFCFIDADKENYPLYLDWVARLLRPGGVIAADNVFLFGQMAGPVGAGASEEAQAMHAFHLRLARSGEFRATVLPTGEGLAVGVRV
jgi:caffeoyl-CoA O-methyltransferase